VQEGHTDGAMAFEGLGRHLANDMIDLGGHHDRLDLLARVLGRLGLREGQTVEGAERAVERAALHEKFLVGARVERECRADGYDEDLRDIVRTRLRRLR
jgi:hypothetical protein